MAENYKVGEKYFLPVTVYVDRSDEGGDFPVGIKYFDGKADIRDYIQDEPGVLMTVGEIIDANIIQARDNDKTGYEELKKRYEGVLNNATEMSDEIKTLKFENERLSKKNEELGTKVNDLEAELQNAQKSIDYNNKMEKSRTRLVDGQTLTIYRKDKTINILIDKIVSLEMMLDEEREKHNG